MSAHPGSISAAPAALATDEAPSPRRAMCLSVNGRPRPINVDPDTSLLRVLRQELGLAGTEYGCTHGRCSACVVHVDDRPTRACRVPVHVVQGAEIVTIEGLAAREGLPPGQLHAVQRAWIDCGVPPCPCRAGMIMAATALLMDNPDPSEAEIEAAVFLGCGCGVRPHALRAIRSLAERLRSW
jgi:isoquinoline 1-oxidoreductase alpha subunit